MPMTDTFDERARRRLPWLVRTVPIQLAPDSWKRILDGWTRRTDGCQTHIVNNGVRVSRRQIANIDADRAGITHRHLYGSIPSDDVAPNEVPLHTGSQEDPVGIAGHDVVDDDIVVGPRSDETDAEVVSLHHITISTQPVRTEPVTACAAAQSYASARVGRIAVPHGDVSFQFVL